MKEMPLMQKKTLVSLGVSRNVVKFFLDLKIRKPARRLILQDRVIPIVLIA